MVFIYQVRTSLAIEAKELAEEQGKLSGVESEELKLKNALITRVNILDENGEKALGRPKGNYITVELSDIDGDSDKFVNSIEVIAHELMQLFNLNENDTVLVVGLGNVKVTPDALGPKTIEKVMVTRHLKENAPEFFNNSGLRQVAAISPGVLGQTGVESAEIIKAVVQKINPALIIVIDALASRRMKRLASTVQLSDTGITPGGGVGNTRAEISFESIGVPIISVGVPTVVDAATLSSDVIDEVLKNVGSQANAEVIKLFEDYSKRDKYQLIKESLSPYDLNLVVTPKDIDFIIEETSKTVGYAINKALHKELTIEDIDTFLA